MIHSGMIYMITGVIIFGIGFYALIAYNHLLRKILSINVMGSGSFMFLIALAYGDGEKLVDPVPHALVITGIVVGICTTGLALAIALQVLVATGKPMIDGTGQDEQ
jgi:multicomponent Na+:H+ antiporter subunit C